MSRSSKFPERPPWAPVAAGPRFSGRGSRHAPALVRLFLLTAKQGRQIHAAKAYPQEDQILAGHLVKQEVVAELGNRIGADGIGLELPAQPAQPGVLQQQLRQSAEGFLKLEGNGRPALLLEVARQFSKVAFKDGAENQIHAVTAFRALAASWRNRRTLPDRNSPAMASSIHF